MTKTNKFFALTILAFTILASVAEAQTPQINTISPNTLARSGRLRITGTGFGTGGEVKINGQTAFTTRWNNTGIIAYVPEQSSTGPVNVQVITPAGASNIIPLTVTLRQTDGRVKWTFDADVRNLFFRPAIGPDGTVYIHGSEGFVFALTPDGGLKWIHKVNWYPYVAPHAGPDGALYVGSIQRLTAINPDGTERWQFSDFGAQGIKSGPVTGPDGNIFFSYDLGLGATSLSPNGLLRWNNPGNPQIRWYGSIGGETVIGPRVSNGVIDQMYVVPEPMGDWTLQAFSLADGSLRFSVPIGGQHYVFGQQQTQPAVGPDGTIYITHYNHTSGPGWVLEAFSPVDGHSLWYYHGNVASGMTPPDVGPDGIVYYSEDINNIIAFNPNTLTPNWEYEDGTLMYHPTVSPLNDIVVTGGVNTFGDVGFIKGISTDSGELQWTVPLPGAFYPEPRVVSVHHPRFTPDGNTVYVSTTILGGSEDDPHSFLYAIANSTATMTLNLRVLIQGLHNPVTNKMIRDTASVYLRSAASPYAVIDSARSILDSTGRGNFTFSNSDNSVPYYIVLKHRNGLETWSTGENFFLSENMSYDFTTSAARAFGNNQILEGTSYCVYSGDVNQDKIINLTDLVSIHNQATSFVTGYVTTDLTGDRTTNINDVLIAYNNSVGFVHLLRP